MTKQMTKQAMMTLKEIKLASSTLASNFRGRLSMAEAVAMMADVQPQYAHYWVEAERAIQAGATLSQSLSAIWPPALVGAVKAGEEAGNMEQVFAQISQAAEIQLTLRKLLRKLLYPAAIGIAGIVVFVGIMVLVAPQTARSFRAQDANAITQLALAMEAFFRAYWMPVLIVLAVGIVAGGKWITNNDAQEKLRAFALSLPYLGTGLTAMYFGLWAHYMAMLCAAGISTERAMQLTMDVMPLPLRAGLLAFERDMAVHNLSLAAAANLANLAGDDPRQHWPLFVRRAFIVADRTCGLDGEMQRIAPELLAQGIEKISIAIEVGNIAATVIAGALVASSFIAIYAPIIGAAKSFH